MNIIESRFASAPTGETPQKPLWRGDHTFDPKAAMYSLENIIEPQIRKKNPGWSAEQIRQEAVKKFETRLRQDFSYEQKEMSHTETAVVWSVVETSPGVVELATQYGDELITLKNLWDHTREYAAFVGNPKAYNQEEEKAQLHMQDAFIKGETTSFISVLSHPDSIRYVQIWEKKDSGEIESKQIDLYASTGRDLSHDEGKRLIEHLAKFHEEKSEGLVSISASTHAHFFIDSGHLADKEIRNLASVLVSTSELVHAPILVSQTIAKDSLQMLGDIRVFIQDKIEKKIFEIESTNKTQKTKIEKVEKKKNFRHEFEQINPIEVKNPEVIKDIFADFIISKTIVAHIPYFTGASGAALFWFRELITPNIKKEKIKIGKEKPKEFFIKFSEKMQRAIRGKKTKKNILELSEVKKVTSQYEIKKETLLVHQKIIFKLHDVFQSLRFKEHPARRMNKRFKKEILKKKNEISIMKSLVVAFILHVIHERPIEKINKVKKRILFTYSKQLVKNGEPTKRVIHEASIKQSSEHPVWILFAIIWFLSMLRESGISQKKPVIIKKRKKSRRMKNKFTYHTKNDDRKFQFMIE